MNYWLFKTEPNEFSIDDLKRCGAAGEPWDGIRNYQARNFLRDQAQVGDLVFIYHSSCQHIGIAGIAKIIKSAFADPKQFNPESKYFDSKSSPDKARWVAVQVAFERKFSQLISLQALKADRQLEELKLPQKGNRLSIMPIAEQHWQHILTLAN